MFGQVDPALCMVMVMMRQAGPVILTQNVR